MERKEEEEEEEEVDYDPARLLPACLSEHSMLPLDPHSGWCDLQGRRR